MSTMRGFKAAGCGEKAKLSRHPMIGGVPERIGTFVKRGEQVIRVTETSRNEAGCDDDWKELSQVWIA